MFVANLLAFPAATLVQKPSALSDGSHMIWVIICVLILLAYFICAVRFAKTASLLHKQIARSKVLLAILECEQDAAQREGRVPQYPMDFAEMMAWADCLTDRLLPPPSFQAHIKL